MPEKLFKIKIRKLHFLNHHSDIISSCCIRHTISQYFVESFTEKCLEKNQIDTILDSVILVRIFLIIMRLSEVVTLNLE